MQFKKLIAAGTLSAIMIGSTVGFAAIKDFPSPFVTASGVQSFVVVGAVAQPSDVIGAVDVAARLGGSVTTDVAVSGAVGTYSVSGEGKALDTATTKVFLNDDLGKSGLRTTLTKDDLPTILAKGSFADADGTHKYDQYIDMTPGTASLTKADVRYGKPGSSSSADPAFVIGEQSTGRLPTSPSATDFLYKARVVFDVAVNGSLATGKSLKLFGNEYTISADTTDSFAGTSADKVVLFGGADIQVMTGGQTITTTVGGTSYEVKLLGVTSTGEAVLQVGGTSETVARSSTSSNFGDLKIYVKDSAQLSTTDQTQNVATLLIGADKLTIQHQSKLKKGNNDDSVDGTYAELALSGTKLSQITVYFGASSSTTDYITAGSDTYLNPVFKTFGVKFAGMLPTIGGVNDDYITVKNSGDNNLQLTMTDYNSNTATINFGYKSSSAEATVSLKDSSGNAIRDYEGANVTRDEYVVLDAGGYPHMFKATSVSLEGNTGDYIDLQDVFSGATTKITTGPDRNESAIIDGQTYQFMYTTGTSFTVRWGTGANITGNGKYTTIYPKLKTKNGGILALVTPANVPAANQTVLDLPSGAVQVNFTRSGATLANWTISGTYAREDGTTSVATAVTNTNDTASLVFSVGRTSSSALRYMVTRDAGVAGIDGFNVTFVGTTGTTAVGNATVALVEEKDDAGNQGTLVLQGTTGTSGSNSLSGVAAPTFSDSAAVVSQSWGSNSNKASSIDIWGTLVVRDSSASAQPTVEVWYPDTQRIASVFVLQKDATVSSSTGASGSVVKSATPVKTALGKLDTEVTSADKSTKNLILVGGPVVNSLVAELATAGKTKDAAWYRSQGAGTALIDLVADAFATGKSALVVAGYEAGDTRQATSALQNYDAYSWVGNTAVLKNGVISSTTA